MPRPEREHKYTMTAEQRVEWEAEVRSLYDGMVRIVVTPTWAKLIDFETTLPSAATAIQHVAIVHDGPNATRCWRRRGGDGQKQVGELSTLVDVENVVLASSQGHQWPRWAA